MKPATLDRGLHSVGRYTPAVAADGSQPAAAAFFIAVIPSWMVISGVALIALIAPPVVAASEKAAASMFDRLYAADGYRA